MTTYLSGGWYQPGTAGKLRVEVLDGAMDAAGVLHRSGVDPARTSLLALKVRQIMAMADPQMRSSGPLTEAQRDSMLRQLAPHTHDSPALHAWVADCLDHVGRAKDLLAFYLHLMHVTQMLQLLAQATGPRPRPRTDAKPAASKSGGKAALGRKKPPVRGRKRKGAKREGAAGKPAGSTRTSTMLRTKGNATNKRRKKVSPRPTRARSKATRRVR